MPSGWTSTRPGWRGCALSEHAIHTWDVAVALDRTATVAPDAIDLLIDTLARLASRTGKPGGSARRVRVSTTDPERRFVLDIGESVTLQASESDKGQPDLRLPAEAFLRLVYGRLDPAHTHRPSTPRAWISTSCEPPSRGSDPPPTDRRWYARTYAGRTR
jgi:hypothetical protein